MYIKIFEGIIWTLDTRAKHLRYWVEHLLTPNPFLSPGLSSSICLAKKFSLYRDSDLIHKEVLLLKTIKRSQDHTIMRQMCYTIFVSLKLKEKVHTAGNSSTTGTFYHTLQNT